MGTDAVAVLHVRKDALEREIPPPPMPGLPGAHLVACGDATLFHTFVRFDATTDELASAIAGRLGPALALHADPRGVLIVPDVVAPQVAGYDAVVAALAGSGFWLPWPIEVKVPPGLMDDIAGMMALMKTLQGGTPEERAEAQAKLDGWMDAAAAKTGSSRPGLGVMRRAMDPAGIDDLRAMLPPELRDLQLEPSPELKALLSAKTPSARMKLLREAGERTPDEPPKPKK